MSIIQRDEATERAQQLVKLFDRRMITESSLVSGIANVITPQNIQAVLASVPPQVRGLIRDWARSLPDDDAQKIIFWPLSREVRLSFKEWLRQQE